MSIESWKATEKEVCRLLGAEHVGGPGQPDCRSGAAVVEVKDHGRKVGPDIIRRTMEKPWAKGLPLIVASTSGFTERGIVFAQKHTQVFLYEADLAKGEVHQIWPPKAEARAPGAAHTGAPSWWPVAAVAGGALFVGGALLALKHWAQRQAA